MEIKNCTSFHYLIMALDFKLREMPFIIDFENCMTHYNEMCGCEGEVKDLKKNDCEQKYQNIIFNNLEEIKPYLLDYNDNYVFESYYPSEIILAKIKK